MRLLACVLLLQLAVTIPLLAANKKGATLLSLLSLLLMVLIPSLLLRRGWIDRAVRCTVVSGFFIAFILVWLSGGIRSPALILQVTMAVNTAMILGRRWAYWIAGLSFAGDVAIALFQSSGGQLPLVFPMRPPGVLIVVMIAFAAGLAGAILNMDSLRHALAERQRLINTVAGVVWEADPATFQFRFVSQKAGTLLGYPVEEWTANPRFWAERLHPDDREPALSNRRQIAAEGRDGTTDYRMIASDGRVVWLRDSVTVARENGRIAGLCGILVDVSEHRLAEQARQASEERLELAQSAANIGLYEFDFRSRGGVFDENLKLLCGMPPGAALSGEALLERIVAEDRERILRSMALARQTCKTDEEFRVAWPDGSIRWLQAKGELIVDGEGAPVRAAGVCFDVSERKQAQQAMEASQQWFRIVADSAPVLLWMSEPDKSGSFFNKGWLEFRGRTLEQEFGDGWLEGVHPDDRERCRKSYSEAIDRREPIEIEYRLRRHDGQYRWVLCRGLQRIGGDGNFAGFIGSCTDITERRQMEEALRESEALLAESQEIAHIGGWSLDLAANRLIWTDEVYRIFGLRPQEFEVTYQVFLDAVHPEDRVAVDEAYLSSIRESREGYQIEHRLVRKRTGEVRWVYERCYHRRDEAGNVIRSVGTVQDITELRVAEKERGLLMSAIEQTGESVVITDAGATIQYVNPAFERVSGYSCGEVLGRNPRILKSGRQDPELYGEMWKTLARGETWRGTLVNRRKDGTLYTEEAAISPVHDNSGKTAGYVAVKRDVTARLETEEHLRQMQKMESIGRLAGGVAHDFNNLLTVINGYTELLLARLHADDPASAYAEEVRKAGERAAELTGQLLAFSRKQMVRPRAVNLNQVVLDSLRMLERLAGEDIEIVTELDPELRLTRADPGQLHQVLMNLVANARDAMPAGGRFALRTMNLEVARAEAAAGSGVAAGAWVVLQASDGGVGMSEEVRQRIFEPFFTTKPDGTGSGIGLGLATVYGIVSQAEGWITVESHPGKGSTFRIGLPRLAATTASEPLDAPAPESLHGSETVLVVEDQENVQTLVVEVLRARGYGVLTARSGAEALRISEQHCGPIHLVLTDVVMPQMGGKDLVARLRLMRPEAKVLYMSGYTRETISPQAELGPGVAFLQKPFSPEELSRRLRMLLDRQ